jgi:starch phosphorylase
VNPGSPLCELVRIKDYESRYAADIQGDQFFGFPVGPILEAERRLLAPGSGPIGYFSMEYGLATSTYNVFSSARAANPDNKLSENEIISNDRVSDYLFSLKIDAPLDLPIYSGGLGVLAGDTIKTCADLSLPVVAVGILWNKGYFKQRFWFKFGQLPEEMRWDPWRFPGLFPLEDKVVVSLKSKDIVLRLWKYYVFNARKDAVVPLVLLDSNVEENDAQTRRLTDRLYKSDDLDGRLLQRLILGMGGTKALDVLKYPIRLYHLNEGHAAFAFIEKARGSDDPESLKRLFAYTCHTPVPAGHDRFSLYDIERLLRPEDAAAAKRFGLEGDQGSVVNLTVLALNTTRSVNAVSQKHGDVMRLQFPAYKEKIRAITNGVHFFTWVSEPILKCLEGVSSTIGDFRSDPGLLKNVLKLKNDAGFRQALWQAHQKNKAALSRLLRHWRFREDVLTIAWARRIAAYKRPSLLLQDVKRLNMLAKQVGPIQILYAGKAHPNDNLAFTYINEIMNAIDGAGNSEGLLKIIMLENYDTYIGKILVSSVDIWLNNPLPPYEASGTSGMKALANGVVQLSTLDGWVIEAADKGIGKFFGYRDDGKVFTDGLSLRLAEDSSALYVALAEMMRMYYGKNEGAYSSSWMDMMIHCLAEAAFFGTHRMVKEYRSLVWQQ